MPVKRSSTITDLSMNNLDTIRLTYPIYDTIVLKHSNKLNTPLENFIKKEFVYLFKKPVEAIFFFRNGFTIKQVNYNLIHQKLVAKSENGMYTFLDNNPKPDSIQINGKSFVVTPKGAILQKIYPSSTNFFIAYESKFSQYERVINSIYDDIKASYPITSITIVYASKQGREYTTTIFSEAKPFLYYHNGKKYIKISSIKNLLSILSNEKKWEASNFLSSNSNFSINNTANLYSLFGHIFSESYGSTNALRFAEKKTRVLILYKIQP